MTGLYVHSLLSGMRISSIEDSEINIKLNSSMRPSEIKKEASIEDEHRFPPEPNLENKKPNQEKKLSDPACVKEN